MRQCTSLSTLTSLICQSLQLTLFLCYSILFGAFHLWNIRK